MKIGLIPLRLAQYYELILMNTMSLKIQTPLKLFLKESGRKLHAPCAQQKFYKSIKAIIPFTNILYILYYAKKRRC